VRHERRWFGWVGGRRERKKLIIGLNPGKEWCTALVPTMEK